MAAATDSTPAPAQRLLRAAGPCRVLTTADLLARVTDASPITLGPEDEGIALHFTAQPTATRHARVLRQHDAGGLPRAPQSLVAGVGLRTWSALPVRPDGTPARPRLIGG